jgi:hypothetical protein
MAYFLLSRKKGKMLLFKENYYTINKTVDEDEYYRCADRTCPGTAIKRGIIIMEGNAHPQKCKRLVYLIILFLLMFYANFMLYIFDYLFIL